MPKNAKTPIWRDNAINFRRLQMLYKSAYSSPCWTRQTVNLSVFLLGCASLCLAVALLVSP